MSRGAPQLQQRRPAERTPPGLCWPASWAPWAFYTCRPLPVPGMSPLSCAPGQLPVRTAWSSRKLFRGVRVLPTGQSLGLRGHGTWRHLDGLPGRPCFRRPPGYGGGRCGPWGVTGAGRCGASQVRDAGTNPSGADVSTACGVQAARGRRSTSRGGRPVGTAMAAPPADPAPAAPHSLPPPGTAGSRRPLHVSTKHLERVPQARAQGGAGGRCGPGTAASPPPLPGVPQFCSFIFF